MKRNQLTALIQERFDHSKEMMSSKIPFSPEVRKLCEQNLCGHYGKSWTCPPAVAPAAQLQLQLAPFDRFILMDKVYSLEDSFDWEGMVNSAKDFQARIRDVKREIRDREPDFKFLALGAGSCTLCKTCSYQHQEPCRNPADAIFSVEAYGIEVMQLMAENQMSYNNGPNTITYIGGIFHH